MSHVVLTRVDAAGDYRSPLARSQKMQEVEQADEFVKRVQAIAELDQKVLDLLNFDATARTYAEQLGIDPSMLNDEGTVKKIRKQRADAQQAAAQAEQQAAMAQQQAQAPQQPGLLE